jgi:hypothetical protein
MADDPRYSRPGAAPEVEDPEPVRGEMVTPSYTEAEWVEVFEAFLADRHCILYGKARPCASVDGRRETARWLAGEVIAAAGEVLEG